MRIVSLLPSATEIVYALGLGDELAGVTFECDHPPEARTKPVVSTTALPDSPDLSAREIDEAVTASMAQGQPIYALDRERIAAIQPDLILAQDLCRVCAVPSGDVQDALAVLDCRADVVSLDPATLDDVIACLGAVGAATGTTERAEELMARLRERLDRVRDAVAGRPRPRTFALEWADPPFGGGHWVPDMIERAGGEPVLGATGAPSRRLAWSDVEAARPEVLAFMPCGYGLDGAVAQGRALLDVPELRHVAQIYAVDANAMFSRPGPRVVDGVETLAWALHPDAVPAPSPDAIARLR
jgi:iron complex transport system substrate-binding protein